MVTYLGRILQNNHLRKPLLPSLQSADSQNKFDFRQMWVDNH